MQCRNHYGGQGGPGPPNNFFKDGYDKLRKTFFVISSD